MANTNKEIKPLVEGWTRPSAELDVPKQVAPYAKEVSQIDKILTVYKGILQSGEIAGDDIVATPATTFYTKSENISAYFFKNKKNKSGQDNRIYCLLELQSRTNAEVSESLRLYLDVKNGTIINGDTQEDFIDTKGLLPLAIQGTESSLRATMQSRQEKRRHIRGVIGGWIGALAVLGGIGEGIMAVNDHFNAVDAHKRAARAAFDASGYNIPAAGLEFSIAKKQDISVIPVKQFDKIPKFHKNEDLSHPRRIDIDAEKCDSYQTHPAAGSKIDIADVDPPINPSTLLVGRDAKGKLIICSTESEFQDHSTTHTLAVQIEK